MATESDAPRLRAEWFWTDRWTGSDGWLLPPVPRCLYREMLTQAWRKGGRLPNDPATIRALCNFSEADWDAAWPLVKPHWGVDAEGFLFNVTQQQVLRDAQLRAERQRRYRAGQRNADRNGGHNADHNGGGHGGVTNAVSMSPSLSLSLSLSPEEPTGGTAAVAEAAPPAVRGKRKSKPADPAKSAAVWDAYAVAFERRYKTPPVRNAKVNRILCQLVERIGEDAGPVAAWYVRHQEQLYVRAMHCVDLLLRDAEKLRTEWATGRSNGSKRTVRTAAEELAYLEQGMDETRHATTPAIAELAASKRLPARGNGNG